MDCKRVFPTVLLWILVVFAVIISGEIVSPAAAAAHRHVTNVTFNGGPYVPQVGRFMQIATCSHDLELDLFAMSEDLKTRSNRDGFDPEVMLRAAFSNANHAADGGNSLSADMTVLLKRFIRHRMSIVSIYTDRFYQQGDINKLFIRYKLVEPPPGAQLSPDDFTLYRLAMAFPYETAAIRARYVEDSKLPGVVATLHRVFAFPYAPLIIPPSWSGVHELWRKWFNSFATSMAGYPLSDDLKKRQEKQYQSMVVLAKEHEPVLLDLMELLGITEATAIKPLCE